MDIQRSLQTPQSESQPAPQSRSEGQADPSSLSASPKVHLGSAVSDREILLRGRRAFERGEDIAALESLDRLTAHGFEYADVYYMLGMLHERRDDLDAALDNLRSAVRINPSYVEALLALASLLERRGDFDQSQGYAERASQLTRPTADALDPTTRGKLANQQAALGDALAQAGEKRDAIEEYRRALDRCPTFHDVRHRLAMTLREVGLPFQAAQEFRRILRVHSGMLMGPWGRPGTQVLRLNRLVLREDTPLRNTRQLPRPAIEYLRVRQTVCCLRIDVPQGVSGPLGIERRANSRLFEQLQVVYQTVGDVVARPAQVYGPQGSVQADCPEGFGVRVV